MAATDSFLTIPFRLAFPEVFEARAYKDGAKAKFSINMIFPADGSRLIQSAAPYAAQFLDFNGLRKLAVSAIKAQWGEDKVKWPAHLRKIDPKTFFSPNGKDGWPFRDGNEVEWDGYAGGVFIRATSSRRPGVVDRDVKPIIDQSEVFGGLIARAQVNAFTFGEGSDAGVSIGLNNLQILKDDGTSFSGSGGSNRAEEAFSAFEDSSVPSGSSAGADDDNW